MPADADIVVLAGPRVPPKDTDLADLTTAVGYAPVSHGTRALALSTADAARRARAKIDDGSANLSGDSDTARGLRCWRPYGRGAVSTKGAHIALDDLATVVACVRKD